MSVRAQRDAPTAPAASPPERLRSRIPDDLRRRLTLAAPVFFVIVALARNFLETRVFAVRDSYSYFTALHHLAWYASAMLAIVLVTHVVLRVPVVRLTWMAYGSVVLFIPILVALATGEGLRLEYLRGSWSEVLIHVATFSFTYKRDWPMGVELLVIFVGMGAVGYLYTRSWRRAVAVAFSVYLTIALTGLAWFNVARTSTPIFPLDTALRRSQPLLAMAWLHVATALLLVVLWRAGVFASGPRSWRRSAAAAAWTWAGWIAVIWMSGWLARPFDIAATALPLVFGVLVGVRALFPDRGTVSSPAWLLLVLVWFLQVAAIAPVATRQQWRLLRPRSVGIPRSVSPRSSAATLPVTSLPEAVRRDS